MSRTTQLVELTQNDLDPVIYVQLWHIYDGRVYDVSPSTTTVAAKFRLKNSDESLWEVTCGKEVPNFGIVSITTPTDGLDEDYGRYEIEVTVTENSRAQTVLHRMPVKLIEEFGDVA